MRIGLGHNRIWVNFLMYQKTHSSEARKHAQRLPGQGPNKGVQPTGIASAPSSLPLYPAADAQR